MTTEGAETGHTEPFEMGVQERNSAQELPLHVEKGLVQQAKGKTYKPHMLLIRSAIDWIFVPLPAISYVKILTPNSWCQKVEPLESD